MHSWYKLPVTEEMLRENPGLKKSFVIAGKNICILQVKEKLHAIAATCPHAGGNMCEGFVDALDNIVCPVHHYRFSLATGYNRSGEGFQLKIYRVEKKEDGWYVSI